MNKKEIQALVLRVPHQRQRAGVANTPPGTYVRFVYKCKPACVRCALEKVTR